MSDIVPEHFFPNRPELAPKPPVPWQYPIAGACALLLLGMIGLQILSHKESLAAREPEITKLKEQLAEATVERDNLQAVTNGLVSEMVKDGVYPHTNMEICVHTDDQGLVTRRWNGFRYNQCGADVSVIYAIGFDGTSGQQDIEVIQVGSH